MTRAGRRRKLHRYNLAWITAITVAVLMVATCVIGLAVTDGSGEPGETADNKILTVFLVLGGLGAVIGLLATITRARGGDKVDEAELDTPLDSPQREMKK